MKNPCSCHQHDPENENTHDSCVMEEILNKILNEHDDAFRKWGTDFDDKNTLNDWVSYICRYASSAAEDQITNEESAKRLCKAAGLIVSSLEALDKNGNWADRHYEKGE